MRFVDFLASTSFFTACCALGLCVATERLILPGIPPMLSGLHMVVFGSTLIVYSLSRLIPNPYGKPRLAKPHKGWHYFFLFSGLIILALGIPALPFMALVVCGISGALAFAYFLPALPFGNKRRLRDYGMVKITVLTAVWAVATAVLPMIYWGANIAEYPFEILLRYVFVFALCILFDIRDMQADINNNIATLPNKVGIAYAFNLVHMSLLFFFTLSVMQYVWHPSAGRLTAAALTAVITAAVALFVKRNPGHKAFVAMTDGMMLLYAILVSIFWV